MTVRLRLLVAIGSTLLFTGVGIFLVSSRPMMSSFTELEDQRAREDVIRVEQSLGQMMGELHAKSVDWANWDDTYTFMKDRNESYIRSNLNEQSLLDMKVDLVLFLDRNQKAFYSRAAHRVQGLSALAVDHVRGGLLKEGFLGSIDPGGKGRSGILMDAGSAVVVSVRPIHQSDGMGATCGWLVFARRLDNGFEHDLGSVTRQDVSLTPIGPTAQVSPQVASIVKSQDQPVQLEHLDEEQTRGYSIIRDIHGDPALLLTTGLPRKVSQRGAAMVRSVGVQVLILGGVFALVVLFVIERFALSRLSLLSQQVEGIDDFLAGTRVELAGGDELSSLATRINEMLGKLQNGAEQLRNSREELRLHNENLEHAVQERTQQIEHQALHDKLTGLPNRHLFMDRLDFALSKARRSRKYIAAVFVDLDNFKLVNDSLGHAMGDELLTTVATRLVEAVRPGDTVARLGGDEFTVLLEELSSPEEAVEVVERICGNLRKPIPLGSRETFACASIGIASTMDPSMKADALLKKADTAMYRAKAGGKGTYVVYDETMHDYAIERLELETSLRKALDNGEITVHYQPLIDLDTDLLMGAEALARWKHPVRGNVSPGEFIPIAEETGLISSIGYWILEEACKKAKSWSKAYDLPDFVMSVNLSGKQLQKDDVVDRVSEILERTQLKPSCLKLELTESVLMHDREDVVDKMRRLKELGLQLALDDFGTGYSSLSTLRAFPIDTLKIDRAFISRLGEEDGAMAIVEAILALARTLRMNVIGEGVETLDQEGIIKSLGCGAGQGYLYDKPLCSEDFEARLQQIGVQGLEMIDNAEPRAA